ncbi:ribonuclease E inhibitor RraB [Krasilnikovia sp. MM14-A1259]|uniref:ribonuclease E inhibitor RraB n=1 Tax=Krasilnikovia sp. MM14-A1259 TaxID=3373539 RepID=UPI00399D500C
MEPQTRALPQTDLETIFGVVATLHGHLLADELPPGLTSHLLERLIEHGPLPDDATTGDMNALLADLCQRLHWAMSDDHRAYPEPAPRRTTHYLDIPDASAEACTAALTDLGGEVTLHRTDEDQAPTNRRHIAAVFPELPPNPDHHARVTQLTALARQHGGEYAGFGG